MNAAQPREVDAGSCGRILLQIWGEVGHREEMMRGREWKAGRDSWTRPKLTTRGLTLSWGRTGHQGGTGAYLTQRSRNPKQKGTTAPHQISNVAWFSEGQDGFVYGYPPGVESGCHGVAARQPGPVFNKMIKLACGFTLLDRMTSKCL